MLKGQISKAARGILVILTVVGMCSCVRNEYDMNNLNTEVTIAQKGLALPLGSTKQIKISELLSQSGDNIISADENGISTPHPVRWPSKANLRKSIRCT